RRRLQATLQSIERLTRPPTMVVIIVPRGREHLIDLDLSLKASIPLRVLTSEGPDDAWLTGGLRQAAQEVDIAIFATEGTIFQGDYVQHVQSRYEDWEDLVGVIEVLPHVIKLDRNAAFADIKVGRRMRAVTFHSLLRRWLRARTLMSSVLT